ncbi:Putative iron-sulfur cluster insertion protein ErpA [Candidatus Vidania fulgoroideae]|uniref:Iron-sulfur cluster insertion protein ErpA n=1 Tax=Candidatus Vidania fulgoroideorum TaxID=881286 RepID=A0A346E0C0_9PROT|nr:Putative iron-sulfur cluster insertion protein ErpA [Candidatus Vidania fulgoroideae]WDI79370.1 hypothetical protein ONB79_00730 [Candidatus Vidania fulgoroideae]WDR79275.1 hypothetical protein ONB65_00095 [Candidatus Vidania fulgoroideae]
MNYIYISKKNLMLLSNLLKKKILFIYVSGQGCMGIKYNFYKKKNIIGLRINKNIYTDILSFFYIYNSKLKIKKENFGYKFEIKNNIIKKKCKCGISFKI